MDWAGSVKQFLEMASAHSKQSKTKPNHHGHLCQCGNPGPIDVESDWFGAIKQPGSRRVFGS